MSTEVDQIAALHARFSEGARGARYDDGLFEAFLEREGVAANAWGEAAWMEFFEGRLGYSREEARELVEQLGEWGPRGP